jgi:MtN3 and saliva related transmembrane protein
MDAGTVIGAIAAVCTTLSNLPQLKKCWETGSAGDLSLRMLLLRSTGVALWIGYGVFRGDWVIIISNAISLLLLLGILFFKLREKPDEPSAAAVPGAATAWRRSES